MPLQTGYIDQDPAALSHTLVEGVLDRSGVTQYAGYCGEVAGFGIDAVVIGASHIVTVTFQGLTLHEMLACVGHEGSDHLLLHDLVGRAVQRELGGLSYRFTVQMIDWQDPEPAELEEILDAARCAQGKDQFGVVQEFPAGCLEVTPKTVIFGYADGGGGLTIETAHSYPNVRSLVLSCTRLIPTTQEEGGTCLD